MSAWIVTREHIDVLVTALHPATQGAGDELGRMLWAECLKSVAYRYPDANDGERPGPGDFKDRDVETYAWTACEVPPSWVLQAAGCYMYQSCEHPGWEKSEAFRLAYGLSERFKAYERTRDCNRPCGVDNPPWGIDAESLCELDTVSQSA